MGPLGKDMESELRHLADLFRIRNAVARSITTLIGRPALPGHLGEFIASRIFGIELEATAVAKAIDGRFTQGPLEGKGVNVKWYGKHDRLLDINPDALPGYFLVFAGPLGGASSSRGDVRPWTIDYVFLFDANVLVQDLRGRGLKVGIATSIRKHYWEEAEVYPKSVSSLLSLSDEQRALLGLFSSESIGI